MRISDWSSDVCSSDLEGPGTCVSELLVCGGELVEIGLNAFQHVIGDIRLREILDEGQRERTGLVDLLASRKTGNVLVHDRDGLRIVEQRADVGIRDRISSLLVGTCGGLVSEHDSRTQNSQKRGRKKTSTNNKNTP